MPLVSSHRERSKGKWSQGPKQDRFLQEGEEMAIGVTSHLSHKAKLSHIITSRGDYCYKNVINS